LLLSFAGFSCAGLGDFMCSRWSDDEVVRPIDDVWAEVLNADDHEFISDRVPGGSVLGSEVSASMC
jgi:hypothetical protein